METYPLKSLSIKEAVSFQFRMVDCITKEFEGSQIITRGDLGVIPGFNEPITTVKAEKVIARFFDAQASMFVRGAGTSAIRYALFACTKPGSKVLVHKAPMYETTKASFEMMSLQAIEADFNNLDEIDQVMNENPDIASALVQYTRQKLDDSYDMEDVITRIKKIRKIPVVTDDNYAVMKVEKIGSQCGADLACFSCFKLLGPEGIGCVVGSAEYISKIRELHYSGGSQTQGFEALDALRGLVYAPVALAIQAEQTTEIVDKLNSGYISGVERAFVANAQSRVVIVSLKEEIAEAVLKEAEVLGAAPNPIGAESKYEMAPMFYRVSGTMRASDPKATTKMIRINPMRSGSDTVLRILKEAIEKVNSCC